MTDTKTLQDMSVNDKAFMLNRLRKIKWSGTPCDNGCKISQFFEGYSKENNMIVDSMIWKVYGLHYKDYLDTCISWLCSVDPIKLEQAIDKKIQWLESELFPPE